MKKLTFLLLSAASILTLSFTGTNVTEFEGKITYEITVEGGDMPPGAMAMFSGSELTVHMKGVKSRSDMSMGMQNTTTISDIKTGTSVILMDMMGNKYKIKSDPAKDEKAPNMEVKYLNDTKIIAGYKCKRADVTLRDEKENQMVSRTVWYTEDISNHMVNNPRHSDFKGIKGMPLEYEMAAGQGIKMKMTAKTVSKESVPDSKFDIPEGYKETTMEDMEKDMMKMMQGGQH
ncbi:MAG: DUF4412 domain-containing protein [Bacteroidetes bacterium]|nr:MAG: DUF4412 domain-containing protein [Bacteroidota bacterium]